MGFLPPAWYGISDFCLLPEVPLQHTLKGLAVSGFVLGHFINHFAALVIVGGTNCGMKRLAVQAFWVRILMIFRLPIPSTDLVNCLPDGTIQTVNTMKYPTREIKKRLGITFKYHYLRHTYGTLMAEMNTPTHLLCNQMGHGVHCNFLSALLALAIGRNRYFMYQLCTVQIGMRIKREEAGLLLLPLQKTYSLRSGIKGILAKSASGADPIFGNILPGRARSDAVFRVAQSGVIDIAAGALVLHGKSPFLTCRSSA